MTWESPLEIKQVENTTENITEASAEWVKIIISVIEFIRELISNKKLDSSLLKLEFKNVSKDKYPDFKIVFHLNNQKIFVIESKGVVSLKYFDLRSETYDYIWMEEPHRQLNEINEIESKLCVNIAFAIAHLSWATVDGIGSTPLIFIEPQNDSFETNGIRAVFYHENYPLNSSEYEFSFNNFGANLEDYVVTEDAFETISNIIKLLRNKKYEYAVEHIEFILKQIKNYIQDLQYNCHITADQNDLRIELSKNPTLKANGEYKHFGEFGLTISLVN